MSRTEHLRAFSAFGIELEYMIVDKTTLAAKAVCDVTLQEAAGASRNEWPGEVEVGELEWSNELVAHVIELKTAGPTPDLQGLAAPFLDGVARCNEILAKHNAMLMPTAMHPRFDPTKETKLWPHGEGSEIYEAYDRIFSCKGHGWSNLQSVHINLPFYDDAEFGKLHAAIRLVLPILPALAASSPVFEGKVSGFADTRLSFYRTNQKSVPEISGHVIPEPAFTKAEYDQKIFQKIYKAIAPHDPQGELQYEWLNSRGAIARFDRNAIEIRVLDIQETPVADAAVVQAVVALVKAHYDGKWIDHAAQRTFDEQELLPLFMACVERGGEAEIKDRAYLSAFGLDRPNATASELWKHVASQLDVGKHKDTLGKMLTHGNLAARITKALGKSPDTAKIDGVFRQLCELLPQGKLFGT